MTESGPHRATTLRSVSFKKKVKLLVFCSILKQLQDEHLYFVDAFEALADVKSLVGKARARAPYELVGATFATPGGCDRNGLFAMLPPTPV